MLFYWRPPFSIEILRTKESHLNWPRKFHAFLVIIRFLYWKYPETLNYHSFFFSVDHLFLLKISWDLKLPCFFIEDQLFVLKISWDLKLPCFFIEDHLFLLKFSGPRSPTWIDLENSMLFSGSRIFVLKISWDLKLPCFFSGSRIFVLKIPGPRRPPHYSLKIPCFFIETTFLYWKNFICIENPRTIETPSL